MGEQSIELVKSESNTPVVMSRQKAMDLVNEAEKLLESVRPEKKFIDEFPNNNFFNDALPTLGFCVTIFSGIVCAVSSITSLALNAIVFGGVTLIGIVSTILSWSATEISILNQKSLNQNKFRTFSNKFFLSRTQRKWIEEFKEVTESYEASLEMYKLLVSKSIIELENKGVFEIINDMNNPENDVFVYFDSATGKLSTLNRINYERIKRDKLVTNHDLLQKVIMQKIVEDKELFS